MLPDADAPKALSKLRETAPSSNLMSRVFQHACTKTRLSSLVTSSPRRVTYSCGLGPEETSGDSVGFIAPGELILTDDSIQLWYLSVTSVHCLLHQQIRYTDVTCSVITHILKLINSCILQQLYAVALCELSALTQMTSGDEQSCTKPLC